MASDAQILEEGLAKIHNQGNKVFYNPAQVVNRDLSVAAIHAHSDTIQELWENKEEKRALRSQKKRKYNPEVTEEECERQKYPGMKIFEALSASGLRSIRYFKEIPKVQKIIVNDLDASAVESIRENVKLNGLDPKVVVPNQGDAIVEMFTRAVNKDFFHVVDLDPYGTACPFLDTAIQVVSDGGLLCVTATDMQNLAGGKNCGSTFKNHGAMPLKSANNHEMALRLTITAVCKAAARHKRSAKPLLSLSINFYVRLFFRINHSPKESNHISACLSNFHCCPICTTYELQPLARVEKRKNSILYKPAPITANHSCPFCGHFYKLGGPLWDQPLHDREFITKVHTHISENKEKYAESKRLLGMLAMAKSELPTVLYYNLGELSKTLHCEQIPTKQFQSAIMHAGYKISGSHCHANAFKTDAPNHVVWDIMRCWVKKKPVKKKSMKENDPSLKILSKDPELEANFSIHDDLPEKIKHAFLPNPKKFWGPKFRATGKRKFDEANCKSVAEVLEHRSRENQGKRTKREST